MKYQNRQKALLVLEDGTKYEGYAVGSIGTTSGEICFNTGMTGYQEIYTDPSYYKQIIVNTTSHIGNYGVHEDEVESDSTKFSGLVCKTFSPIASRLDGHGTLEDYFKENGIVGISDVDTRAVVKHVRSKGAMNAIISSEDLDANRLLEEVKKVPSMDGLELSSLVSTQEPYFLGDESATYKVAVLDLGVKKNILRNMVRRDIQVKVFPGHTSFDEIMSWEPHGFFISNGPGDPAATTYAIETATQMINSGKPVFGICLGHQIIALANGIGTYKMHSGHRGLNQPVKNLDSGSTEVTSQNHGFSVKKEDVENHTDVEITHINLNDDTVEGIKMNSKPVFSVQHHPEAAPGPNDANYLFDKFEDYLKQS